MLIRKTRTINFLFNSLTDLICYSNVYPIWCFSFCKDFPLKKIIKTYFDNNIFNLEKLRVIDPCAGWGNRALSSCLLNAKEYIAFDPSYNAVSIINNRLDHYKGLYDTKCKIFNKPYEDATEEDLNGKFDIAICCPPYFVTELYQTELTSTTKYSKYDNWLNNWYYPFIIDKTIDRLKDNGIYFLTVGGLQGKLLSDTLSYLDNNNYHYQIYDYVNKAQKQNAEATIIIKKSFNDNNDNNNDNNDNNDSSCISLF